MLLPKGASTRTVLPASCTLSRPHHKTSDFVARRVTSRFPALAPTASAPAHAPRSQHALPAMAAYGDAAAMAARIRAGDALGLLPPQYPALAGCEPGSFAEATITTRLPAILSGMMADVRAELGDGEQVSATLAEVEALRQQMLGDAAVGEAPLHVEGAAPDTQVLLDCANACVELARTRQQQQARRQQQQQQQQPGPAGSVAPPAAAAASSAAAPGGGVGPAGGSRPSWLGLPWLLVECYMYAALHAAFQRRPATAGVDPFARQKAAAWAKSAAAAVGLAEETELLLAALERSSPSSSEPPSSSSSPPNEAAAAGAAAVGPGPETCRTAVLAALQMALWGNKADLSLLVNAEGLGEQHLNHRNTHTGAGGCEAGAGAPGGQGGRGKDEGEPPRVIVDDSEAVWRHVEGMVQRRRAAEAAAARGAAGAGAECGAGAGGRVRVDIVLDNSGLELFSDLCLADVLMATGCCDTVVLHGKSIPWFVSDTLAGDLEGLLDSCAAEGPPQGAQGVSPGSWQAVRRLASRRRAHLSSGRWQWRAHPFWTTPVPYCWMAGVAPELYGELAGSGLVVLKGDLNYRKLTHDCRWPHTTPFETALQGFRPAPLLALRTLKADVVAGLESEGLSRKLSEADKDWLVNGKWGMIQAAL